MASMKTMQFLPKLQKFLERNGKIYTVRAYDMAPADVMVGNLMYRRIPLGQVYKDTALYHGTLEQWLEPFVDYSGFDTVSEWCNMIWKLTRGKENLWLYKIEAK